MSYKKKKQKKNIFDQLRRKLGMIKRVLLSKIKSLIKKQPTMQKQTEKIMQFLRSRAKVTQESNLKINEWVGEYIDDCILNGKPVEILTQLCLSKGLEVRLEKQGGVFTPTKSERSVYLEEIPAIIEEFKKNGISINWYFTFNRAFSDIGRIDKSIEQKFCTMVKNLLDEAQIPDLLILNWEDDVIKGRNAPDIQMQQQVISLISPEAYRRKLEVYATWTKWYSENRDMICSDEQIRNNTNLHITCEAEEGKFLTSSKSLFSEGKFLLVPLERPESYDFFDLLVPDFKKRIVPILMPYPWRM